VKRALIAMSGGVDSSVAALLLQREGWDCTGVTLRLVFEEYNGSLMLTAIIHSQATM